MNIAVSNVAWEFSENDKVVDVFHHYDVKGIEIAPTKVWESPTTVSDAAIKRHSTYWTDKGITPVAIQSILFGHTELTIFQDKITRTKTLSYLKEMIRVSAVLGAKAIVFGSPKNRITYGLDHHTVMDIAIPFFTELGEIAKQYHMFFCIEPNAKAYGNDFITNTNEGVTFVQMVNHPNVGLNLDTGIMTINQESYADVIARALPYVYHVHISEPFLEPIGTKETNHLALASALRSVNYTRWVSVEMKGNKPPHNIDALDQSLKLVTSIYR